MTDPIIDRLDQIKSRADKATEGPWGCRPDVHGNPSDGPTHHTVYSHDVTITETDYSEGGWRDAEFIATAREDVPRMEAALRAVLDLHVKVVTDQHVAGPTAVCEPCSEDRMFAVWPCPTVTSIEEALS